MVQQNWKEPVIEYLNSAEAIHAMIQASERDSPAIEGIAEALYQIIGEVIREHGVKKQIGKLVKDVMESNGYQHDVYGRRSRDSYFSSGSVYTRRSGN
jgi:hypothetical protein